MNSANDPGDFYWDRDHLVWSTLQLPFSLCPRKGGKPGDPLVEVVLGPVASGEPGRPTIGGWQVLPDRLVGDLVGAGRASIVDGRHVTVQAIPGIGPETLGHVVAHSVLTIAAIQRGTTVVHAALLEMDGRTIALCAPSGTGKSTLAASLRRRGAVALSDDQCFLHDTQPSLVSIRASTALRLLPDAAWAIGIDPTTLPAIPGRVMKYADVAPAHAPAHGTRRLDGLFLLQRRQGLASPIIESVSPVLAVPALVRSLLRRRLTAILHGSPAVFAVVTALAETVPVYRLIVPDTLSHLAPTADAVGDLLWQTRVAT